MATERTGINPYAPRNTFDKSPERPFRYYMRGESSARIPNPGMQQRNKSYDFLLTNKNRMKKNSPHNVSQVFDKSNLSLWGLIESFGTEGIFSKVGELDEDLSDASLSDGHIVLLTEKNKVLVRGRNDCKQLGFDSKDKLTSFKMLSLPSAVKFTRVECGGDYTFALGNGGEVFSWGLNLKGQLGHGHFEPIAGAAQLKYLLSPSADGKSERTSKKNKDLGDDIKLEVGERVIDVACGALHSLLITNLGKLFSCGYGETYALGHSSKENIATFTQVQSINGGDNFDPSSTRIAAGICHSACIQSGRLYVWGIWGSKPEMIYKIPTAVSVTIGGSNAFAQPLAIKQVALGDLLTVILTETGAVYTLGDNKYGQLGISDRYEHVNIPELVPIDKEIVEITCGSNHVFSYTRDCKQIYAWGSNKKKQILVSSKNQIYNAPTKISQLRQALVSRIVCGPRATFCVSRLHPELSPISTETVGVGDVPDQSSKLKDLEIGRLREEKDAISQNNLLAIKEIDMLKQEIQGLKQALVVADKAQTRRGIISNASTQTQAAFEDEDTAYDVMQHFRRKLKIDRTLKPCFEIDYSELTIEDKISEGGFGLIYQARWRETIVAVKELKPDLMREETIKDFLNECYAMESLRHPNIVMFMGACTKLPNLCIVLEFCSRKSLWNLLQKREINLNWQDKRTLAIEIARGMNYLHSFPTPVLHRDLKRPKIADFGWTRLKADDMTGKIGTYQWMAPEVIKSQKYSEKADVFSFGIIMWEIASREPPYRNITGPQVSLEVVNNDLRPPVPQNCPEEYTKLMKLCWDRHPGNRPTFLQIIKDLERMNLPQY